MCCFQVNESLDDPNATEDASTPSPSKISRLQKLREHLEGQRKAKEAPLPMTGTGKTTTLTTIQRAMSAYESEGRRPFVLEQVYTALSSINPTSAEAEDSDNFRIIIFQPELSRQSK